MDGVELFQLGRRLMRAGEAALKGPDESGRVPPGVTLIMMDVVEHPGSAVREIVARTGFPQGHVSTCVARLRERGVVETTVDPADGRRTLVTAAAGFVKQVASHRGAPVDAALAEVTGIEDPRDVAEVIAVLDSLARKVLPKYRETTERKAP
ncbi:MarR family winged helix-turn-helix transcriptional regulator [Amycolatopsis sp. NBC_01286]|uniref:MarR family winged helix-turn-helix transcriptional regulator n=1 Tax=Amycolatopsis sp. NBC_01286 TaxID=2903560 RepID=UPI002E121482|nr:MarR family transcriptional regulator [Amycolatopsis sp. NBC_01286]